MSEQQFDTVVPAQNFVLPAAVGNDYSNPIVLYKLQQYEVARVEAVTFQAVYGAVLTFPTLFVLQLTDPNGTLLFQYLTPFIAED